MKSNVRSVSLAFAGHVSDLCIAGKWIDAIGIYKKVIEDEPDWLVPRQGLGFALIQAGLFDEAESVSREALLCAPDDYLSLHRLGALIAQRVMRSGSNDPASYSESVDIFRRLVELQAGNSQAWMDLARTLVLSDRSAEAYEAYMHAVLLAPSESLLNEWKNLARKIGFFDKAIGDLRNYISTIDRLGQDAGNLWLIIASMYQEVGNQTDAEQCFQEALFAMPTSLLVRQALSAIEERKV